ncbi:hypothetical protein KJ365_00875 [Glaciecola sp. XM2]|uniref:hypothetical protein n=1 Tax=Glaciecola sp. XM2 TaxID=1914931 RepID=UPI001BDE5C20|nr:hypothetical protein [Glaciecola sp. XM2]MBT1449420.1 hypothetical protein [Glaciecola sp. XM2]
MSNASKRNNVLRYPDKNAKLLTLVLDEETDVAMADKPVFGTTVTIRDDIDSFIGTVLHAGLILGWLNYVDVTKFACLTENKHYLEAANYFHTEQNQLVLSKPIILHEVDNSMNKTKQVIRFSALNDNVTALS